MPRKTSTKAQRATVSRDEARDLYLRIFDDFSLVVKDKDEDNRHLQPIVDAINERLDGSDQANGEAGQTIVRDWVNSDYEVWQCFQTYDSWTREQAEAAFDEAWPTTEVEIAAPKASTTVASGVCHCGCKGKTSKGKGYLPGHDARHAGQVARAILATPVGGDNRDHLLATLPTEALRNKALAQIARGNAKQTTAKPAPKAKVAVKRPSAEQEPGTVLDGFVTYEGDLQPAQRGVMDGRVYLNINDARDGSGDWLDSEGFAQKSQAYWLKRFVVRKDATAPVKTTPRKRTPRTPKGDGPQALKELLTF